MTQFHDQKTIAVLAYSAPNDTYTLLAIEIKDGRFATIDTERFKKGQAIHNFELLDAKKFSVTQGKSEAKFLVVVSYNGCKLKQFTFGLNRAVESRKVAKIDHNVNCPF